MHMPMRTLLALSLAVVLLPLSGGEAAERKTAVSIDAARFRINGRLTYEGRTWRGLPVEGLLMNSRMVQGTFDDLNPQTVGRWAYPDTGRWDAERNVREFLAAMPVWRRHGLLSFTLNLQGGSPEGYSQAQPWVNNAFEADGRLRPDYAERLRRILDFADELGMVPIVGYFYFGQDQQLADEAAVLRAVDGVTRWLLDGGWRNVLVEVNNECDVSYDHAILRPARIHELIARVAAARAADGRRLLVSTSYQGNRVPAEAVVRASDFVLLHGNGVRDPGRIVQLVAETRAVPGYRPVPILFNEDDHFDFENARNNFTAALGAYASWGFFDYRMPGEGFEQGFQSLPVDWSLSSERKRGFFRLLAEITGAPPER